MPQKRRTTIYLDPAVHRTLRQRAAETDRSLSDLVNEVLGRTLGEDADDLAAIAARESEPTRSFEAFVSDLAKKRGTPGL